MSIPPGLAAGHGLWSPAGTTCPWWDIRRAWWCGASLFAVKKWLVSREHTVCPESPTPGRVPSSIGQLCSSTRRRRGAHHHCSRGHRPRGSLRSFRVGLEGKNDVHNHPQMPPAILTAMRLRRWAGVRRSAGIRQWPAVLVTAGPSGSQNRHRVPPTKQWKDCWCLQSVPLMTHLVAAPRQTELRGGRLLGTTHQGPRACPALRGRGNHLLFFFFNETPFIPERMADKL